MSVCQVSTNLQSPSFCPSFSLVFSWSISCAMQFKHVKLCLCLKQVVLAPQRPGGIFCGHRKLKVLLPPWHWVELLPERERGDLALVWEDCPDEIVET